MPTMYSLVLHVLLLISLLIIHCNSWEYDAYIAFHIEDNEWSDEFDNYTAHYRTSMKESEVICAGNFTDIDELEFCE
ncbi:hypothetical protein PFISCL1PPCAC_6598, partial [Pristionchus fissidentatus]